MRLLLLIGLCLLLVWVFVTLRRRSRGGPQGGVSADAEKSPEKSESQGVVEFRRRLIFGTNRPEGDWVNWKIGTGWFEVAETDRFFEQASAYLLEADRRSAMGKAFGVAIEREAGVSSGLAVMGVLGPHEAPEKKVQLGVVPADAAREEALLPDGMPRAVELKQAEISPSSVEILLAGLVPGVKQRREMGFEEVPEKAPRKVSLSDDEIAACERLIERMARAPVLSQEEAGKRYSKFMRDTLGRMQEGERLGEATGTMPHLSLPDGEREAFMARADNDLMQQLGIVERCFDAWFKHGEAVPPYYPWRIAIILRKAGRKDIEKRFLDAWCRHFPEGGGVRYEALVERARKLDVSPD